MYPNHAFSHNRPRQQYRTLAGRSRQGRLDTWPNPGYPYAIPERVVEQRLPLQQEYVHYEPRHPEPSSDICDLFGRLCAEQLRTLPNQLRPRVISELQDSLMRIMNRYRNEYKTEASPELRVDPEAPPELEPQPEPVSQDDDEQEPLAGPSQQQYYWPQPFYASTSVTGMFSGNPPNTPLSAFTYRYTAALSKLVFPQQEDHPN